MGQRSALRTCLCPRQRSASRPNAKSKRVYRRLANSGLGACYRPSYDGSDQYVLFPAPLAQGSVGGFDFGARDPRLYVDLIADGKSGKDGKLLVGLLLRFRMDRNNDIKDPVVRLLGKERCCGWLRCWRVLPQNTASLRYRDHFQRHPMGSCGRTQGPLYQPKHKLCIIPVNVDIHQLQPVGKAC